jgi:hypothetical protein
MVLDVFSGVVGFIAGEETGHPKFELIVTDRATFEFIKAISWPLPFALVDTMLGTRTIRGIRGASLPIGDRERSNYYIHQR